MPRVYKYLDAASRLEERSTPIPECGCFLWTGHLNNMGYGRLSVNGRMEYAHRVAYALRGNVIPNGVNVLHHCDTPSCVNPEHMFLGSHADNVADKVAKNRHLYGSRIGNSRLTEEIVREIRSSPLGVNAAARHYGVSPMTVSLLRRRKTWRHAP
jgi:hypothetical protein